MDGIPLLSGRPPIVSNANEDSCRRCNKEFNFLFARSKQCNHCGYPYCSSCTDYQALMPRSAPDTGYELVSVCAYCMEMLTITSSGKNKLRRLPMAQLRAYMEAYNIHAPRTAVEKDDLVEAILKSKNNNGCLYSLHEDYYRRNSVPQGTSRSRNFFSRSTRDTPSSQPQTPYTPRQTNNAQSRQTYNTPPPTRSHYTNNTSSSTSSNQSSFNSQSHSGQNSYSNSNTHAHSSDGSQHWYPNPYPTDGNRHASASHFDLHFPPQSPPPPQQRRPRSATASAPPPPPPPPPRPPAPVPTLNELLEKQDDEIARLPISALKAILFENRVNITIGVLEKDDLVRKVVALVTDEKRDREIKRQEELEEARRAEQAYNEDHPQEEDTPTDTGQNNATDEHESSHAQEELTQSTSLGNTNSSFRNHPHDMPSSHEGLCVVCQDEHANMAIIDCGHLALCKLCSELVMQTSRECPLCRTRIVTEQRLLRIFRT